MNPPDSSRFPNVNLLNLTWLVLMNWWGHWHLICLCRVGDNCLGELWGFARCKSLVRFFFFNLITIVKENIFEGSWTSWKIFATFSTILLINVVHFLISKGTFNLNYIFLIGFGWNLWFNLEIDSLIFKSFDFDHFHQRIRTNPI